MYEITELPEITRSNPSNDELFDQAREALEREKESEEFWNSLGASQKAAVQIIMTKLLRFMDEHMEEWLPSTLKFDNSVIDVNFRILMHEIDDVISQQHIEEENAKLTALKELEQQIHGK